MALKLVLAEDDFLVREGISGILSTYEDMELVGACGDYDSLLETVEREKPDVVLTDIRMPPTGTDEGIRAANYLAESSPRVGVVVLSQYDEPDYALALLEHGSEGRAYLLKERVSDAVHLTRAIREVAGGGSVIDPKVVESLVAARSRHRSPMEWLTAREADVMSEMAQGRNNAGIAEALDLSVRAVEKHINSIFSKLALGEEENVHKRVRAVLMFLAETG